MMIKMKRIVLTALTMIPCPTISFAAESSLAVLNENGGNTLIKSDTQSPGGIGAHELQSIMARQVLKKYLECKGEIVISEKTKKEECEIILKIENEISNENI